MPGEDAHVLVHHRGALGVGGARRSRSIAGDGGGDEGARLVAPAVHVGDGDAVLLEQLLELHLVLEREERRGVGAVAAHHDLEAFAVAVDVDEPDRPPAGLPADRRRRCRRRGSRIHSVMRASVVSMRQPRVILRPMISFMISVVPP